MRELYAINGLEVHFVMMVIVIRTGYSKYAVVRSHFEDSNDLEIGKLSSRTSTLD